MTRPAPILACLLAPALCVAPRAFAQPADAPPTPPSATLAITPGNATLTQLERSLAEAVDPLGHAVDDEAIETLHRVSTAADRVAGSTVPAVDRQAAAEIQVLAYHALAASAQQRDRPTETGLRLMQARTAAEELRAQGSAAASDAGRWWRLVTDLADAQRLDEWVPSPRAQRTAIDSLRAYIAQADADRDAARIAEARVLLVDLAMEAGRAELARRTLADLTASPAAAGLDPGWVSETQRWLSTMTRRVTLPDTWLEAQRNAADASLDAQAGPPAATAWVVEADPALPLARAVRAALGSGDYPRVELTLIYAGDRPHAPIVLDRVHRLTGSDAERATLDQMGVTRVPTLVLLNASRRIVASGQGPAVLDALTFAP
ncbi:MAG: hypothetical protein AAF823_00195 [Planctomycetota bacterium]